MEREKTTVFLGGTCAGSTWREELMPMLGDHVETYNPVVPNWTPECRSIEDAHRKNDDICLYVITPEGEGFYSFVEVIDDSHTKPARTVHCIFNERKGKENSKQNLECAKKTAQLAAENGATICTSLEEVAAFLNGYQKEQPKKLEK